MAALQIVVGLGNPGARYAHHRHNVGFRCLDYLAKRYAVSFSRKRLVHVGEGFADGTKLVLAKPRTFVNLSGEAVAYLIHRFGASPSSLLVVYDDLDLPLGKLRLREKGSSGGHNGMKSIIAALGTEEFPRLRIGIGRPHEEGDIVGHVLSTFSSEERLVAEEAIKLAAEAVHLLLTEGLTDAMNRVNQKGDSPPKGI